MPLGGAPTVSGGFASLRKKFSTGDDCRHSDFRLAVKDDVSSGKSDSGFFLLSRPDKSNATAAGVLDREVLHIFKLSLSSI